MIWEQIADFFRDHVWAQMQTMQLVDVLDILFLGVILFLVYRFLRSRRAGQLLLGLLLVLLVLEIASIFHMRALGYLLDKIQSVVVLGVIVVFQPEIRAAFEKIGTWPLSGLKKINADSTGIKDLNNTVNTVCEAAAAMSREKVGALMAFERVTKLTDYIRSGVTLDATPSVSLIRNVFFNKAPLHDGAMILRRDRVVAASCFLPLSTRSDILVDLGTRHRAAIGLSEQSDAVVVVVSEETGTISVAVDGTLRSGYNYATLKQELLALLDPTAQERRAAKAEENGGEDGKDQKA